MPRSKTARWGLANTSDRSWRETFLQQCVPPSQTMHPHPRSQAGPRFPHDTPKGFSFIESPVRKGRVNLNEKEQTLSLTFLLGSQALGIDVEVKNLTGATMNVRKHIVPPESPPFWFNKMRIPL